MRGSRAFSASTVASGTLRPMNGHLASPAPTLSDVQCTLSCLDRLLARRQAMDRLGVCPRPSPCGWCRSALDRAIVGKLLLAAQLGMRELAAEIVSSHQP